MAQPTQLNPTEQDALVKQIGLALLQAAPDDWEQVTVGYRAVGRYAETFGEAVFADDSSQGWPVPPDIVTMFGRLRAGMYREGRGTWFNAHYRLDRPSSYNLDYDRDEPKWTTPPPPQAYTDELRTFPRDDENVPEWLMRRLAGLAPEPGGPGGPGGPRFRIARIFDGTGSSGRPLVNRPPVNDDDRGDLLHYLDGAPVVVPGRGFDIDRLDAEARPSVPVAFHSDGTWIWPAAVNYYLRSYGVPPERELVEHIRRRNFEVPEVDEPTRSAAAASLNRGAPPPPGPVPPPRPIHPPEAGPAPSAPPSRPLEPPGPGPARQQQAPPPAALPSQGPPALTIGHLRARLIELGVPAAAYRIGPPVERTWTMEQTPDGWRVGWYEREFLAPAMFEDVADASAFLLGKIMMDAGRATGPARAPADPIVPPPEPPPRPALQPTVKAPAVPSTPAEEPPVQPGTEILEPARATIKSPALDSPIEIPMTAHREPPAQQAPARVESEAPPARPKPARQGQEWPVQPMPGEPPLTLFRGKRVIQLAPGTEIDRFGDEDGNLTYAVGTPFEQRSLVPEWINRSYHTYRVAQPLQALTGAAIPWFDQPGGGTAYLLSSSIGELLANGLLVEVDGREPPQN